MLRDAFYDATQPLFVPGMGTEQVAPLLYHLIRMLRPRSVMEIGLGYTTPFILRALADNVQAVTQERALLHSGDAQDERRNVLLPDFYHEPYEPKLVAIDDFSQDGSSVHAVTGCVDRLGLTPYLELVKGDFHGASTQINRTRLPFDFIWFDCGGAENSAAFFNEYWQYLKPEGGHLAMHFTYRWQLSESRKQAEEADLRMMPGHVLTELKRQLQNQPEPVFELSSLIEPHKWWQGSLSLLRRIPQYERDAVSPPSPFGDQVDRFSLTG